MSNIHKIGSKAARLIKLDQLNFKVPKVCCLSSKLFFDFLDYNNFNSILNQLDDIKDLPLNQASNFATIFKEKFEKGKFSKEQEDIIESQLNFSGLYAVRSSAIGEDLSNASAAGMYDSFLEVKRKDLHINIIRCFSSYFNIQAIIYRNKKNIPHDSGMAVIVQKMIYPEFAGVLFTVDPGNPQNMFLEIAEGLGDKIVSGDVNPCMASIDRATIVPKIETSNINITTETLRKIGQIGIQLEKIFEYPQDIEFAVKNDDIFILQSRPITVI